MSVDNEDLIVQLLTSLDGKVDTLTSVTATLSTRTDGLEKQVRKMNGKVRGLLAWKHEVENAAAYSAGWAANNKRMLALMVAAIGLIGTIGGVIAKAGMP